MLQALQQLNNLPGGSMTLFAIDEAGRVCGALTDGDIRRALLGGHSLESKVRDASHASFRSLKAHDIEVEALKRYRNEGITVVPVLNDDGTLAHVLDLHRQRTLLPLRAVLMAGGKGERLRPATLTTPKPLLKIEGKAIIDYNIEALAACGISDITVSTRYLAGQLDEHFATPVAGVCVKTIREEAPLGTIGALSLIKTDEIDTLVMNSDLITTISFEDMYLEHKAGANDVTIAVIPYQVSVPYAIISFDKDDDSRVCGIEEKPSYSYYANAGIYIFSPRALSLLACGEHCDATTLIERAIEAGYKVGHHTIKGTWIDVGSPVDFRQAAELMRHHNAMNS